MNGVGEKFRWTFEPRISLGNLLTLVAMIVAFALWAGGVRSSQDGLSNQVDILMERVAANERSLELFRDDRERLTRVEAETKAISAKTDRIEDKVDRLIERGDP